MKVPPEEWPDRLYSISTVSNEVNENIISIACFHNQNSQEENIFVLGQLLLHKNLE